MEIEHDQPPGNKNNLDSISGDIPPLNPMVGRFAGIGELLGHWRISPVRSFVLGRCYIILKDISGS